MKKRRDDKPKEQLKALWQALDEAAFGPERILNLRESLPSAAEARARTEVWLRGRQVSRSEEVLVITGRGNGSVGGVGVIRQEILGMLPSLRRRGVVESWREHSPGSVLIKLAPVSVLLGVGRRRRDSAAPQPSASRKAVTGLRAETHRALRELALQNLAQLGIVATDDFIEKEMGRTFSMLLASVDGSRDTEAALHDAIVNALDEE